MTEERFLVTGALGCIGAWVVRNLVHEGVPTAIFDHGSRMTRLKLILTPGELRKVRVFQGDIANMDEVIRSCQEFGVTNIIHLAALQLPFCQADPPRGALVNVVGTVNVFETAKRLGLERVVYASSAAVYGASEDYPEGPLEHDAPTKPRSHYGVYKQCNEGTAHVYWADDGISSIGLRPDVVYGVGRDQGMTSSPTKAMLAAAMGVPYRISYGGRLCFQYADDVAKIFIRSSRAAFDGAEVFNVGGETVSMEQIVACIERARPDMKGAYTYDPAPLPFPEEMDNSALKRTLGDLTFTPLEQGVSETIELFSQAIANGKLSEQELQLMFQ